MMTTLFNKIALFLAIVALCACQTEKQEVVSPNGDLRVTIECIPENAYGEAVFSVDYKGKQVPCTNSFGHGDGSAEVSRKLEIEIGF